MTKHSENTKPSNSTKTVLCVVYLVIRVDTGENEFTTIEKTFKNKKDADNYKEELSLKYKESFSFQNKFFYFYVEEQVVY